MDTLEEVCGDVSSFRKYHALLDKTCRSTDPFVPMLHVLRQRVMKYRELVKQFYHKSGTRTTVPWYLIRAIYNEIACFKEMKERKYSCQNLTNIEIQESIHRMDFVATDLIENSWTLSLRLHPNVAPKN